MFAQARTNEQLEVEFERGLHDVIERWQPYRGGAALHMLGEYDDAARTGLVPAEAWLDHTRPADAAQTGIRWFEPGVISATGVGSLPIETPHHELGYDPAVSVSAVVRHGDRKATADLVLDELFRNVHQAFSEIAGWFEQHSALRQ